MENWRKYLFKESEIDTGMPPLDTDIPKPLNKVEQIINSPTVKMKLVDNLTKAMNVRGLTGLDAELARVKDSRDDDGVLMGLNKKNIQKKSSLKLKNVKKLVNKKLFNQKLNLSDLAGDIPGIPQEIKDLNIKAELDFKDIRKPSTGVLKVEIPIGDGTTFRANLPTKLKKVGKGNISVNLPTEFGEFTLTAPADLKNKEQGFSLGLSGRF